MANNNYKNKNKMNKEDIFNMLDDIRVLADINSQSTGECNFNVESVYNALSFAKTELLVSIKNPE